MWERFGPYIPVAQRQANAKSAIAKKLKKGEVASPVKIEGRKITKTFWGDAWCKNLESYSDFANRLPRGQTYARNGSVVHLASSGGKITAYVSGSELYTISIEIAPLPAAQWATVKRNSKGKIGSLVSLLRGELSQDVMATVTNKNDGLFPKPKEIKMRCSCPDYAGMCKHLAATMYGIGHRLDTSPELLFQIRGVDHKELIESAIPDKLTASKSDVPTIANDELSDIFGIDMAVETVPPAPKAKVTKETKTAKVAKAPKAPAAKPKVAKPKPKPATVTKPKLPKKG